MIFCTIGTQAPFDRFVKIIDEVAAHLDEEIIAQVYKSEYVAQNIRTVEFLPPDEFNKLFSKARLIWPMPVWVLLFPPCANTSLLLSFHA